MLATVLSFLCSLLLAAQVQARRGQTQGETGFEYVHVLWTWAAIPAEAAAETAQPEARTAAAQDLAASGGPPAVRPFDFRVDVALRADPLSAMMLAMVTFVSALVAIYSAGYMQGDPGYPRFFTYLALFVFSMTMLVAASNFVLLYVFWEAVGLCSYLLIGFWFQKPAAAAAGKKAFLVNRVGDFGFALGVFLLFTTYGTLNFHDVAADGSPAVGREVAVAGVLGHQRVAQADDPARGYVRGGTALAICLCLLAGACGKSAQFPLHVWLPDAMEGPTPVSALIHAATMVTAGVYMVARCTPLFMAAPEAQAIVACVGGFTALLAAVIALSQTDLKRVLAYSTVSQLGFMFMALGTGTVLGVLAAMFHLLTHAFFKALLFLGAGSVIHAMHTNDIKAMGGLARVMPATYWTFLIGTLALAGVPPFAGFWSKDEILLEAFHHHRGLYAIGLAAAFLTAFYMFRVIFYTFTGTTRSPHAHPHESPAVMTRPLWVLAAFSAGIGLVGAPFFGNPFHDYLHFEGIKAPAFDVRLAALKVIVVGAGIAAAAAVYHWRVVSAGALRRAAGPLVTLVANKYYFDELYAVAVVRPTLAVGRALRTFDVYVIDLIVNLFGFAGLGLARLYRVFDLYVVDGVVNLLGWIARTAGGVLRYVQTGRAQNYLLAIALGVIVLLAAGLFR
ncbi:MAG: NADH-quinone oxidoreductase subunit L [Pirellulales bacterium]|nr:NADH-quinone oxidoreductase subunit L [Pirellulales bacterium]